MPVVIETHTRIMSFDNKSGVLLCCCAWPVVCFVWSGLRTRPLYKHLRVERSHNAVGVIIIMLRLFE